MAERDENRPRGEGAPQDAGDLFEGIFRRKRREPVLAVSRLRKHWPAIVGDALARVTWPARIARGVLWINALDSGWAFNLQFVKSDLLNAARVFLGNDDIRELRYKAGAMSGAAEADGARPRAAALEPAAGAPPRAEPAAAPPSIAPAAGAGASAPGPAPEPPIADATLKTHFMRASAKLRARRAKASTSRQDE